MANNLLDLDAKEFSSKLNEDTNAVLLDVRTPNEYNRGHIPNAKLINMYDPGFTEAIQQLDKEKNYFVYCRSGNRSYHAGQLMLQLGFKNIYNLSSGIIDWDGPIEK